VARVVDVLDDLYALPVTLVAVGVLEGSHIIKKNLPMLHQDRAYNCCGRDQMSV
jgi:hypothetical protein